MPAPIRPTAPLIDADELRDHLENALDHWFSGTRRWFPAIDLIRRPTELVVLVDVPGLKSDDIRIEVAGGTLMISGERRESDLGEGGAYLREERRSGPFSRSIALPGGIDATKIDARVEDGLLVVTVPLSPETDTGPIQIKARK